MLHPLMENHTALHMVLQSHLQKEQLKAILLTILAEMLLDVMVATTLLFLPQKDL